MYYLWILALFLNLANFRHFQLVTLAGFLGFCVKVIYYWYVQPENIDLVNEKPKVILANHL